jgi:hypothetical protein
MPKFEISVLFNYHFSVQRSLFFCFSFMPVPGDGFMEKPKHLAQTLTFISPCFFRHIPSTQPKMMTLTTGHSNQFHPSHDRKT